MKALVDNCFAIDVFFVYFLAIKDISMATILKQNNEANSYDHLAIGNI